MNAGSPSIPQTNLPKNAIKTFKTQATQKPIAPPDFSISLPRIKENSRDGISRGEGITERADRGKIAEPAAASQEEMRLVMATSSSRGSTCSTPPGPLPRTSARV